MISICKDTINNSCHFQPYIDYYNYKKMLQMLVIYKMGYFRYREILKTQNDTFFLTPMRALSWRTAFTVGDEKLSGFESTF
jgi:hypothetical protein